MGKKHHHHINRRDFLGTASCAAMGYTTLFSTLNSLKFMNAAAISNSTVFGGDDYKALICISLGGGNDSFNMLVPHNQDEYDVYADSRTNMALSRESLLKLDNESYAVHAKMGGIKDLYENGKLSFITNVGTLVERIEKQQFYDQSVPVPLGLYSHADQYQQWQTGMPTEKANLGWAGRIADLMGDMNSAEDISMNISVDRTNLFLRGNEGTQYVIKPFGPSGISGYNDENGLFSARKFAIDNILEQNYQDQFKKIYVENIDITTRAFSVYNEAIQDVPTMPEIFDYGDIGQLTNPDYTNRRSNFIQSLESIVRTIQVRETLGFKRQIFFLDLSGWDMHDELPIPYENLISIVNDGLSQLNQALELHNLSDCVTTFTLSEFARTLTSNGSGTDHAWGGNVMVMGGAINGGQIFGNYPSLELWGDIELGGGVLIPELSTDEYFAELAMWFGVSPSDLSTVFPGINNFYDITSNDKPIGFMNY